MIRLGARDHLGRGVADAGRRATLTRYDPGSSLPPHEHAEAHLCLILAGGFRQTSRGRDRALAAGEVGAYPVGDRHDNRIGQLGALCLNLPLPAALGPDGFRARPLTSRSRLAAARIADDLASGRPWDPLDADALAAELASPALSETAAGDAPLERVFEAIDSGRLWTLAELAAHVDRHPTHLARAFRRATGLSIGAWRRRQRVRALMVDLRTTDRPLSDLALGHGYSDQAHMTREVKTVTGRSPGAWRSGANCVQDDPNGRL